MRHKLFKVIIFFCLCLLQHITNANEEARIHIVNLLPGDIIFWKDSIYQHRAGHVAVFIKSDSKFNGIIAHATDNAKYYSFIETHLPVSNKLINKNKYYYVVRFNDQLLKQEF